MRTLRTYNQSAGRGGGEGGRGAGTDGGQLWLFFSGLDLDILPSLYLPPFFSALLPQRADNYGAEKLE